MVYQQNKLETIRFVGIWFFAGVLEYPFLEACLSSRTLFLGQHPILSLLGHSAATALLYLASVERQYAIERLWPKTLALFNFFLPGFGILTDLVFYLCYQRWGHGDISLANEDRVLDAIRWQARPEKPSTHYLAEISGELDILPLADILAGEDHELKRGATRRLAEFKSPESIQLLNSYRSDPSPEVRFYVTSALTRVKEAYDQELEAARAEMKKKIAQAPIHLSLAKRYSQYAQSHLLDEEAAHQHELEAIHHLEQVIRLRPKDPEAYWLLTEIYLNRAEWNQALATLASLSRHTAINERELAKKRIQVLFEKREFGKLQQEFAHFKDLRGLEPEWQALTLWWNG